MHLCMFSCVFMYHLMCRTYILTNITQLSVISCYVTHCSLITPTNSFVFYIACSTSFLPAIVITSMWYFVFIIVSFSLGTALRLSRGRDGGIPNPSSTLVVYFLWQIATYLFTILMYCHWTFEFQHFYTINSACLICL